MHIRLSKFVNLKVAFKAISVLPSLGFHVPGREICVADMLGQVHIASRTPEQHPKIGQCTMH